MSSRIWRSLLGRRRKVIISMIKNREARRTSATIARSRSCLLFGFRKIKILIPRNVFVSAIRAIFLAAMFVACAAAQNLSPNKSGQSSSAPSPWNFAVSGDSRNCGDMVMPAIAAGAVKDQAQFYWHLGDLRKISAPDEDYRQEAILASRTFTINDYEREAWDDFIRNQTTPFGTMPFFLGIGNHETIPPKTRAEFVTRFSKWLDMPELHDQRLKDDPRDFAPKTYYHWIRDGIDFINLDNASHEEFTAAQMKWFEAVIARDASNADILTVVVGMHEALPDSISFNHAMDDWKDGQLTGGKVYLDLLKLQNESHKIVYVLASHSHYFMDGIFNTEYWRTHGGVLPGWIIGTAGAERYRLPREAKDAKAAKTNVYGYLLATVNPPAGPPGTIAFQFVELRENDIPSDTVKRFTAPFVHECFIGNQQ